MRLSVHYSRAPRARFGAYFLAGASLVAAGLFGAGTFAHAADAADTPSVPQAAVTALNRISGGPHQGYRANHAKGVLLTGHFTAAKTAASLSKASHFKAGRTVPVLVRFSNGTGVPDMPDADPNASPHGMAIRFTLPDKSTTDIVSISAKSFPVARPEEFVEFLTAVADSGTSTAKPSPVEAFLAAHPKADAWVHTPRPAPTSFATLAFYGVNAFKFTNAGGKVRFARYQILPLAGEQAMSAEEIKAAPHDFLMNEIKERVVKQPVKYRLVAQLAEAGDAVTDGSIEWPATRPSVELGILTLDGAVQDQVGEQKRLMFSPLFLPKGIEPSDDPVLLVRPAAYAISYLQRVN
jgi:catalase